MAAVVSIIVPAYNVEDKIEKCIKSILNQRYSDIELLCINDGSVDNTGHILDTLAKTDSRMKVIHNKNQGVSATRNYGIKNASGKYIQFVDSDDYIDDDMVLRLVEALETNQADVAICGYRFSNDVPTRIPQGGVWKKKEFVQNLHEFYTKGFFCSPINKLYIKEKILEMFDTSLNLGEDAVFNLNYFSNIDKVCCVDFAPYFYYVGNDGSLSWRYNPRAFECETKKNSKILSFLQNENEHLQIELFKEEFKADFKRCLDNEIIRGTDSKKDICKKIYDVLKTPLWSSVYGINAEENSKESQKICHAIDKYISSKIYIRYRRNIKQIIKKILCFKR